MLRATTACTFSSLIWPAGSAPAALASLLSTLRSHKSLEKHSVLRLSYLFAHLLSSDLFSSDSSHLCFSTVHIVGSFTSKLPSIIHILVAYVSYVCIHHALCNPCAIRWSGDSSEAAELQDRLESPHFQPRAAGLLHSAL